MKTLTLFLLLFCIDFIIASVAMAVNLSMGFATNMYTINHTDPNLTILAFCKMRIYILQTSAVMYRWYLTVACVDRFALSSV